MDVLDSQRLSAGRYVAKFEKLFAEKHGCKYGVMCNSGTSALHIALETLKEIENWDENTEVLVPALTFIASSNACLHAGLKPVFVDVDAKKYTLAAEELEKKITPNTKCILVVHVFGLPCDMDEIMEIAKKYNLRVIEDCADSHFATYKGKTVGSFGDMAAFSTYVAHTITTGVGGIVTTNNEEYEAILRSLIAHGRACTCRTCVASEPGQVCKKRLNQDLDKRFTFERMGFSYRVGEIEGALGLAQLERADEIMEKRRKAAELYTKSLSEFEHLIQLPKYKDYLEHTFMMYPILILSDKFSRSEFVAYLESNNIETRPMFPLLNQPVYRKLFGDIENEYPVAKMIDKKGFYIGCHHELETEELQYIVDVMRKFLENYK